jgi:hypothetical protein
MKRRVPLWVSRVGLATVQPIPLYPSQRTSSGSVGPVAPQPDSCTAAAAAFGLAAACPTAHSVGQAV